MLSNPDITYEITSEYFTPFKVTIRRGQLIWCSDNSHPVGSNWKYLREHYEGKTIKCEVKEWKEEDFGKEETVS